AVWSAGRASALSGRRIGEHWIGSSLRTPAARSDCANARRAMTGSAAAVSPRIASRSTDSTALAARVVPWIALTASIISTFALVVVLARAVLEQRSTMPASPVALGERGSRVIPPGHEAEILRLVAHGADGDMTDSERPTVASIEVKGGDIV